MRHGPRRTLFAQLMVSLLTACGESGAGGTAGPSASSVGSGSVQGGASTGAAGAPTTSTQGATGNAAATAGQQSAVGATGGANGTGGTTSGGTQETGANVTAGVDLTSVSGVGGSLSQTIGASSAGSTTGAVPVACSQPGEQRSTASFVHPGGLHKQSDLDRMRLMVQAGVEPYATQFVALSAHPGSSFDYTVRGDQSQTVVNREGTNSSEFQADATAAYLNALAWAVTQDVRHAEKSVEIFNAWKNVTEVTGGGTEALNAGLFAWKLVEAAEIIKSTYAGWATEDIQAFAEMLVYPGYSKSAVPATLSQNNGTFYWRIYMGDPGRHGNQDLIAWRALISMGVFLDNRVMFDRALNYFKGEPHRPDDLPYASGPPGAATQTADNEYFTTFQVAARQTSEPDYGYNGVLQHYVWESGQNQESSRDQQHAFFGLGTCAGIAEVAWNQGDAVYNALDLRLLKGFEHMARYNVSFVQSYPDQPTPWEPSGSDFLQRSDRTLRWFSKRMNPHFEGDFETLSRGDFAPGKRPVFEQPLAHYQVRMGLDASQTLWTERGRDLSIEIGGYEGVGWTLDHPGWGALTFRRPTWSAGDPIRGFVEGVPDFAVPELPGRVSAIHYDYFPVSGEGRTYHDVSPGNSGAQYRADDVDILCGAGDRHVIGDLADGEWLSYTVAVPVDGEYQVSLEYSATQGGGSVRLASAGSDVISGGVLADSAGQWVTEAIGHASLRAGVQTFRLYFSGVLEQTQLSALVVAAL